MLHAFSSIRKPATTSPPTFEFSGEWSSDLGSRINLTISADGSVIGKYRAAAGFPYADTEFPLVGFANGELLSFTVSFGKYGLVTSWAGQLTREFDRAVIKTMWLLARNVPDPDDSTNLWGAVLTGYNNFMRKP